LFTFLCTRHHPPNGERVGAQTMPPPPPISLIPSPPLPSIHSHSYPFGFWLAHRHWSTHMSSIVFLAVHPSSLAAVSVAAHTATVSPGRRAVRLRGTFLPDAFSNASTISSTDVPVPVPRL
jgi:hypothetical protein